MTAAWVAELNGHVVGHAAVNHPQAGDKAARMWSEQSGETEVRVGVLARLFVGREARNASAGANLVKAATSYARQSDLRLVLDVLTKDAAAIRLYERLGWQRIGETVHVFGDGQRRDAICFVSPTP
ncbi:GNAT family N-acetyltransferase [Streptomyces sp. NPDC088725]|uniref:GNAT family N-acetyltransferase n=1 Tax=Streptomyces sp. NPDC088725 TaxID=3365873 RepID=UPI00380F5EE4